MFASCNTTNGPARVVQ